MENKKAIKRFKVASIELGLRGWIPASKVQIIGQELDSKPHGSHSDKILASRETEALVECPVDGVKWVPKQTKLPTHDKAMTPPPATPESLTETSAKDCPDCHGTFVGEEGEKCPTCGRFAVQALKTQLPPQILPQRYEVNASSEKKAWTSEKPFEVQSESARSQMFFATKVEASKYA